MVGEQTQPGAPDSALLPKKQKVVLLLSSMHDSGDVDSDDQQRKPEIIKFYNSTKGSVDTLDQMIHEYMSKRHCN